MAYTSPALAGAATSLRERGGRLMERVKALRPLAGGYFGAASLVVKVRLAPSRIHTVAYNGKPVAFRTADELALREVLVDGEYGFLTKRLRDVDRPKVIDIGAHIGTFAIWLAAVRSSADLICVEADPATFQLTERNFAAHGISGQVIQRAGSARDGEILRLSVVGPSMSHRIDRSGEIEVKGISLSSLIDMSAGTNGRVDLVKIDVEGSEEALICAAPVVLRRIDALVVELHPNLCDTARVRKVLAAHYADVVDVLGRTSSKPLLYCQGNVLSGRHTL